VTSPYEESSRIQLVRRVVAARRDLCGVVSRSAASFKQFALSRIHERGVHRSCQQLPGETSEVKAGETTVAQENLGFDGDIIALGLANLAFRSFRPELKAEGFRNLFGVAFERAFPNLRAPQIRGNGHTTVPGFLEYLRAHRDASG
jgi:hypothetical protein